jgi:GAF domain-containing protein
MNDDLTTEALSGTERHARLAQRFVSLADTLVDDFDVVDLMDQLVRTCVDLLGAQAAGLLLVESRGSLQLIASSSEEARLLELFQLQSDQGPCLDCVATAAPVDVPDIAAAAARWPKFAAAAAGVGFVSVYAVPMRLRSMVVGGLNLFSDHAPPLGEDDKQVAQALADVATIGLLQQRMRHRATELAEQLQHALDSRIVIEQAKGVLAEHGGLDMDRAYQALRTHARDHNLKLSAVAASVVRRTVRLDSVVAPRPSS